MSRRPTASASTLLVLVASLAPAACADPAVSQPLPFNHRIHKDNAITCVDCHQGVLSGAHAGIPEVGVCMQCHEGDITQNPAAVPHVALVRLHAAAGTELPWRRLHELPAHVYYSHRRHVAIAQLECSVCHDDIGERTTPPAGPVAQTLAMSTCMACHEERGVENDCARCHR